MNISKDLFNYIYWRLWSDVLAGVEDAEIIDKILVEKYYKYIDEDFDEEAFLKKCKKLYSNKNIIKIEK